MRANAFERASGVAARRPALTLAVVLALALAGAALALGLRPTAGIDTFVGASSPAYRATADEQRHFGGDPVIVLVHERLPDLVQTKDLATLTQLEACLAGQYVVADARLRAFTPATPGRHAPYGGWHSPCGRLARAHATRVVYGPGTFLNRAVAAVNAELASMLTSARKATAAAERNAYLLALGRGMSRRRARAAATAAGRLESAQQVQSLERLALNSGLNGVPSIDDEQFIGRVVFDATRGAYQPKARFAYLFPNRDSALIQVRLRSGLSDAQRAHAIAWIRQAVRMPRFALAHGGTYTVTGVPVMLNDLATTITGSIAALLIAALAVMALALLVVFRAGGRAPARLLPLALALAATAITFGLLAVAGAGLTLASIAVLPILIGLAVDYGVQFQARVREERGIGSLGAGAADEPGMQGRWGEAEPVARAAGRGAPAIGAAAAATGTGFLVLLLSPVPMVRGFGVLLVVGIAVAFAVAVTAGSAALAVTRPGSPARRRRGAAGGGDPDVRRRWGGRGARRPWVPLRASARGARELLAPSVRGAGDLVAAGLRAPGRLAAGALARPLHVLAAAAALAALGWVLSARTPVQSDVTRLVPPKMPALRDLRTLERVTGVSGEIDVIVRGADVATPAVVSWMTTYENQLLRHFGYVEERGCATATLCPALSLPDLFSTTGGTSAVAGAATGLTRARIDALLTAVPSYFSQAVITRDRREATLAFGIRLMPLGRQQRVIDYMRARLHPPAGTTAALAGLPVLAAQANATLSSPGRRLLTVLVGLLAVGLVLAVLLRRPARALVPMAPIVLATGWSGLVLYLIGIPLNPMSATLGALVIAVSTEFSVLLSERCRHERAAGHDLPTALARAYRSTGAAVLTSGIAAIMGFGVLVLSQVAMLRDFGLVTLIDLTVSLAGVLLVLPAVIAVGERASIGRAGGGAGDRRDGGDGVESAPGVVGREAVGV